MSTEIMNNSILEFEQIQMDDKTSVSNFTRMNLISIADKWYDEENYLEYRASDDEKIEAIALKLYGTTDLWDFLLLYNGMPNFFSLPVNYDIVVERSNSTYERWYNRFGVQKNITGDSLASLEEKGEEILNEEILKNELFRDIKYIKPILITEFLKGLEDGNR